MKRIAGSVEVGEGKGDLDERAVEARRGESKMERERIVPAVRRVVVVASVWARRIGVEVEVVVILRFWSIKCEGKHYYWVRSFEYILLIGMSRKYKCLQSV